MAGAWSCPHEADERCTRVGGRACEPGMKGCVLYGRYVFFDGDSVYAARASAPAEKIELTGCAGEAPERKA